MPPKRTPKSGGSRASPNGSTRASPSSSARASPSGSVRSPKTKRVPKVRSTDDAYVAIRDDDSRAAVADAGPQLPYLRALLLAAVLLTAAIILAVVAQYTRNPPPYNATSSSSSSIPYESSSYTLPPYLTSSPLLPPSPSSSAAPPPAPSTAPASSPPPGPQFTSPAAPTSSPAPSPTSLSRYGPSALAANGTVHVVFSSHLDVGFSNLSANVIQRYFDVYYPLAVNITRALHNSSTPYVYMTHAYVLGLLFDCPPNMGLTCPSAALQADVASIVRDGDLTFHAFPFNAEMEFYTTELFEAGIQSTFDLADKLGRKGGRPTVISQRDVPGTTIGVIPTMVKNGIRAFSIGANGGAAPAQVGTINRWTTGGQEVYLLFHGGGYGGTAVSDAVIVPGWDHILIMQWNTDNSGPENTVQQVRDVYASIAQEFPGWTVQASTFDQYIDLVDAAVKAGDIKLPVVTQEMGDTWTYGFGSDPRKSGEWNILQRLHAVCTHNAACDSSSAEFKNFSRLLTKGGEHTWGGDHKTFLGGYDPNQNTSYYMWNNTEFATILERPEYRFLTSTFIEQREWSVTFPLQALPSDHPIRRAAPAQFASLRPQRPPSTTGMQRGKAGWYTVGNVSVQVAADGGLAGLKVGDRVVADESAPLAGLVYQLFTDADYTRFLKAYMNCDVTSDCTWAFYDYGKVGLDAHSSLGSRSVTPSLDSLYVVEQSATRLHLLANLTFTDPTYHRDAGAPSQLWASYLVTPSPPHISLRLEWFDKTPTRVPEAFWLRFNSTAADSFLINKLGVRVDGAQVMTNGSAHLHGTAYGSENSVLDIQHPPNAPFVCLGEPTPFPTPLPPRNPIASGLSVNLVNNIWGTNYPLAYPFLPEDANTAFTFGISVRE